MRCAGKTMKALSIFSLVLLATLAPENAFAGATLTCAGPVPVGYLYDTATTCNGVTGLQNLFSGLVCDYQMILDHIMAKVYCAIQDGIVQPLSLLILLFIMIYGLQLIIGMVQPAAREVVTRLLKICLVWFFATQAVFGIGVVYNFFIDFANQGISWMLAVIPMPAVDAPHPFCAMAPITPPVNIERLAFSKMDYLICKTITGPFTASGAALSGFFAVMAWVIPPLFMMFIYFIVKSLAIFVRCLFSYLLCISAIAFMITLSPIFMSFALFRPTYRFFDDWLRYLISFTMQIILIFGGAALWITVMMQLGGFFESLAAMVRPVKEITEAGGMRNPIDTWGICRHHLATTPWGPKLVCDPGLPLKPSELINHQMFMFFMIMNLLVVAITAYVFDTLMKMIPGLARQLAGPAYAPQIGGGQGMGAVNFGKFMSMEGAGKDSKDFADKVGDLVGKRDKPK